MPQMGPNQWLIMSNMVVILLILPTISNFTQSQKLLKNTKKEQPKKVWKW